ncbi:MAG: FecR domain-containing protein [Pseudomonadota bacterium]
MCISRGVAAAVASVFCLMTLKGGQAAAETIGRADRIQNTVTGLINGRTSSLARGDEVFRDQRIRTRAHSSAQFRFIDNTRLAVGANSSIVLDEAVFSGGRDEKLILKAARGAFRFASGSLQKKAYQVVTPSSTVGVRGTMFDVFVGSGGETILTLLQGELTACNGAGACRTLRDPCGCLRIDQDGSFTTSTGLTRRILQGTPSSQAAPFLHFQSNLLRSIQAPRWIVAKCTGGSATDGQDTDGSGGNGGAGNGGGNGGRNGGGGTGGTGGGTGNF